MASRIFGLVRGRAAGYPASLAMTSESTRWECLVLSPIGEQDSETRDHSDRLLEEIVQPALENLGYTVRRGDQIHAQWITPELIDKIQSSDLIVSVLTELNPNVFFEMGVAQAWCRPLVCLAKSGTALPFDVKDLNTVYYPPLREASKEEKETVRQQLASLSEAAQETIKNSPYRTALGRIGILYSLDAVYSGKRFILEVFESAVRDVLDALHGDYELIDEQDPNGLRRLGKDLQEPAQIFQMQSRALHKTVRVASLPPQVHKDCLSICECMSTHGNAALRLAQSFQRDSLTHHDVTMAQKQLPDLIQGISDCLRQINDLIPYLSQ